MLPINFYYSVHLENILFIRENFNFVLGSDQSGWITAAHQSSASSS